VLTYVGQVEDIFFYTGAKLKKISIGVILHNLLVSMSIAKSFSLILKRISENPLVSFDTNGCMLALPLLLYNYYK
jgi:hypothetical protein